MKLASLRPTLPALLGTLLLACGEGDALTRVADQPTPEVVLDPDPDVTQPVPGVGVDDDPEVPVDRTPVTPPKADGPVRGVVTVSGHVGYGASATAVFLPAAAVAPDVQSAIPFLQIPLDTCALQTAAADAGVVGVDVGASVALGRRGRPGYSLSPDGTGAYYTGLDPNQYDPNTGRAVGALDRNIGLDVALPGSGTANERRFAEVIWVPSDPRLTLTPGPDGVVVMRAGQPFSVTFEAGGSDEVLLTFYAVGRNSQLHCRIADDGEFTLTPEVLSQIAPNGSGFCLERYNIRDVHLGEESVIGVAGMIHSINFVIQ